MAISLNKTNRVRRLNVALVLFFILALTGLSACEMYKESYFTENRIKMQKDSVDRQIPTIEVREPFLDQLAKDYVKKGKGPLDIAVSYDPQSSVNTAAKATDMASTLASVLRRYGVDNMNVSILPVAMQGNNSQVFVSYDSYDALPPDDCPVMGGIETRDIESDPGYRLGCSVDTIMAKQVARSKDLAGQSGEDPTTDGRRSARIVEVYRAGSKDAKLEGESATGN